MDDRELSIEEAAGVATCGQAGDEVIGGREE